LSVEVESGNVRIGEIALSRKNALKTLSEVAGAPTRTNRVDELTIYAFDKQGILLYADKQAGKDWLLLYFEPVGGTNGAQNPFLGTLMIRSNPVTTTTASKSLAAIPQLELSETATNVFSAKCDGLGLSFAYLKTPDRLSLVQIDLE